MGQRGCKSHGKHEGVHRILSKQGLKGLVKRMHKAETTAKSGKMTERTRQNPTAIPSDTKKTDD